MTCPVFGKWNCGRRNLTLSFSGNNSASSNVFCCSLVPQRTSSPSLVWLLHPQGQTSNILCTIPRKVSGVGSEKDRVQSSLGPGMVLPFRKSSATNNVYPRTCMEKAIQPSKRCDIGNSTRNEGHTVFEVGDFDPVIMSDIIGSQAWLGLLRRQWMRKLSRRKQRETEKRHLEMGRVMSFT